MKRPMLSIIIPIYNAEKYLQKCLDSILAAELEDIELLLVDDGSTDTSGEICREYARNNKCIKYVSQKNSGPSAARNHGLELSSGEYIAFFDGDDYINSAAFRRTLDLLNICPEAEVWVSDFCRISDNGCILDRVYQIDDTSEPIIDTDYLKQFLSRGDCVWNVWRYLFKREFLIENEIRFIEGVDCAEDLEFAVRVLTRAEKLAFFHNPYYFYRVNYASSLTRRYDAERVGYLTTMLQCSAKYLKNEGSETAQLLLNKIALEFFLNLALLQEVLPEERTEVRKLLQETSWVMKLADGHILKLLGIVTEYLKVDAVSKAVYCLKRIKRRLRKIKVAAYKVSKRGVE